MLKILIWLSVISSQCLLRLVPPNLKPIIQRQCPQNSWGKVSQNQLSFSTFYSWVVLPFCVLKKHSALLVLLQQCLNLASLKSSLSVFPNWSDQQKSFTTPHPDLRPPFFFFLDLWNWENQPIKLSVSLWPSQKTLAAWLIEFHRQTFLLLSQCFGFLVKIITFLGTSFWQSKMKGEGISQVLHGTERLMVFQHLQWHQGRPKQTNKILCPVLGFLYFSSVLLGILRTTCRCIVILVTHSSWYHQHLL